MDETFSGGEESVKSFVESLLAEMTLEEKVAQLGCILPGALLEEGEFSEVKARAELEHGIGHVTKPGGESGFSPEETAGFVNRIQNFLRQETRLGIPAMVHEECLSGYMGKGGTAYPQIIGLASSWDPGLLKQITSNIRKKIRAIGGHQVLSPVLDLARDLRWGRVEETFGEDPYLSAVLGQKYIQGLQGPEPRRGIFATAKHFGGHGAPEGGRNHSPVNVSERELRENFFFPFEVAVKQTGIESVMSAYHDIDGVPCTASEKLLKRILREEWGFEGFVISDGHSVKMLHDEHRLAENEREAGVMALEAGLDLEGPTTECFGEKLLSAVRNGDLSEEVVDRAVRRHLKSKYRKGLFDGGSTVREEEVNSYFNSPEERQLARRAGRESIVLLKNDNSTLPLRDPESVAVIGPSAENPRNMLGDYSYGGHYEAGQTGDEIVTLLEAVRDRVPAKTEVFFAEGCKVLGSSREGFREAVRLVEKADVALTAVGGKSGFGLFPPEGKIENYGQTTGEGNDRTDLQLPGVQKELIEEISKTGTPIVVVLINGRPLTVHGMEDNISAILEAWLPGEAGGGPIADVLFGDYNPSGKLPVTIPKKVGQSPVYYRRKPISKSRRYVFCDGEPLYPFGFGLSYTNFKYGDLKIDPGEVEPEGTVKISCKVENTGEMRGEEIVQLYTRDESASVTRPERELKGFARVPLDTGEKKRLSFALPTDLLAFYGRDMELCIEPGIVRVMVGSSSEDIRLAGEFEITGKAKKLDSRRTYLTQTKIEQS